MHRHRNTSKKWNAQPYLGGRAREGWCANHTQKQSKKRNSNHFILVCFRETFNIDIAANNLYISSLFKFYKISLQILNVTNQNIPPRSVPCVTDHTFCILKYRCVNQKSHTCQQTLLNICVTMTQQLCNIFYILIDGKKMFFPDSLHCNRGCWVYKSYFHRYWKTH